MLIIFSVFLCHDFVLKFCCEGPGLTGIYSCVQKFKTQQCIFVLRQEYESETAMSNTIYAIYITPAVLMPHFWAGLMVHMDFLFKMTEIAASINFDWGFREMHSNFTPCTTKLLFSVLVDNRTYYLTFSLSAHSSGSRDEDEAERILFRTVDGESVFLKKNLM